MDEGEGMGQLYCCENLKSFVCQLPELHQHRPHLDPIRQSNHRSLKPADRRAFWRFSLLFDRDQQSDKKRKSRGVTDVTDSQTQRIVGSVEAGRI